MKEIKTRPRVWTNIEWLDYLKEDLNGNFSAVTGYITNKDPVVLTPHCCKKNFTITPAFFKKNPKCPYCNKRERTNWTVSSIKEYLGNDSRNLELLSENYKNVHIPLLFRHSCGKTFESPLNLVINGRKCECETIGFSKQYSFEEVKSHIENDGRFELLSCVYINTHEPLSIKCNVCNHKFEMTHNRITVGKQGCPECGKLSSSIKRRKDIEILKDEINLYGNGNYTLITEDYLNNKKPIVIKHNECGRNFEVSAVDFLSKGVRCNHCYNENFMSYNSTRILEKLKKYNLAYSLEYKDDRCKNLSHLRFDFAVFNFFNDNTKILLIEYDGEQHFTPKNFGNKDKEVAIKKFKQTQFNDGIKNNFAREFSQEFLLLRVSNKNINTFLSDFETIYENNIIITEDIVLTYMETYSSS